MMELAMLVDLAHLKMLEMFMASMAVVWSTYTGMVYLQSSFLYTFHLLRTAWTIDRATSEDPIL